MPGEDDEYWEKNLLEGQVHLGVASKFNDPFDSAAKINLFNHKSDVGEAYTYFSKGHGYYKEKRAIDKVVVNFINEFQNGIKLSCFTETWESILMWSYYTLNHQGFCLEYDTQKDVLFNGLVLPVIYKANRYDATTALTTRSKNLAMNPVLYKADVWSHEKEWRVFIDTKNKIHQSDEFILKDSICGVYLGARVTENKHWEDMLKKIKKWGVANKIPIYSIELDKNKYQLNRKRIL